MATRKITDPNYDTLHEKAMDLPAGAVRLPKRRSYYHEHDYSMYSNKDARGHPLDEDNDPLLELLKEGKR